MTDTKNSNREFEYDAMRAVAAITVGCYSRLCNAMALAQYSFGTDDNAHRVGMHL